MMRAAVAMLACLVATPAGASANVWQQAIQRQEPDLAQVRYDDTMRQGDDALEQASARDVSVETVRAKVEQALAEYRNAAAARPDSAEPWFRIAAVLYSFYVRDSEPSARSLIRPLSPIATWSKFDRDHARATVDAWDRAEKLAPLDPRFTVTSMFGTVLSNRAILETWLIDGASPDETQHWLRAAAHDYETLLSRCDAEFTETEGYEQTVGNLAETYMMLDDLDHAVDMYRGALRRGAQVSTAYGLAVALDRADQPVEAMELIRQEGENQYEDFLKEFRDGGVFFVPVGEVHYYLALIAEAFGQDDDAISGWQAFIASNAHPEFQPRARQHLDALLKRHGPTRRPRAFDFDDIQ
jgi:tetratricopeptide (TPR) repeat protein